MKIYKTKKCLPFSREAFLYKLNTTILIKVQQRALPNLI